VIWVREQYIISIRLEVWQTSNITTSSLSPTGHLRLPLKTLPQPHAESSYIGEMPCTQWSLQWKTCNSPLGRRTPLRGEHLAEGRIDIPRLLSAWRMVSISSLHSSLKILEPQLLCNVIKFFLHSCIFLFQCRRYTLSYVFYKLVSGCHTKSISILLTEGTPHMQSLLSSKELLLGIKELLLDRLPPVMISCIVAGSNGALGSGHTGNHIHPTETQSKSIAI